MLVSTAGATAGSGTGVAVSGANPWFEADESGSIAFPAVISTGFACLARSAELEEISLVTGLGRVTRKKYPSETNTDWL